MTNAQYPPFEVKKAPELSGASDRRYAVAIIGAGPIGLSAAIDLAQHGVPVVLLDDNNVVSIGSRAICWAKRTLDIFDRLGVGERMVGKGVTWQTGRLFHGHNEVFNFDLLPDAGHKMPAFINLQQYHVEQFLVERTKDFPDMIDLRFKNRVVDHVLDESGVTLSIETPDGAYALTANYVLACDGARSPTRQRMGLAFEGQSFEERFLIADIHMNEDPFPEADKPERWFWFKPPFHEGQSALLHKQPDNIYRIDLQLGPDADPDLEKQPERVIPRIKQVVGDKPFELDWVSVYRFSCARLEKFIHGRLLFVGDSAHVVSPFGARGGNGGIHDVDNLCWKLAAVVNGEAPETLLQSYEAERGQGADENIQHSARATRFMSPANESEMLYRDEVLDLAADLPFARSLINSGRLSTPCVLTHSSLQVSDVDAADSSDLVEASAVGCVAPDLQTDEGDWLLSRLGGAFVILVVGMEKPAGLQSLESVVVIHITATPHSNQRYGRGIFLIRPDQHIAARWTQSQADMDQIRQAVRRASGHQPAVKAA